MRTDEYLIDSNLVDPFLGLSIPSLFRILQRSATTGAEAIGAGKEATTDKGYLWVLTRMEILVERMPAFMEKIKVSTYPGEQLGFFYFRHFYAQDEKGSILFRVSSTWALLEEKTHKVVWCSPFSFPFPKESHPGELGRPEKLRTSEGELVPSYQREITYSMCDLNGHLNNTRYLELAVDTKGREFYADHQICRILINFEKEIKEKEKVDLLVADRGEDSFFVVGKVNGEDRFMAQFDFKKRNAK